MIEEIATWLRRSYEVSVLSNRDALADDLAQTTVGVIEEPLPRFVGHRSTESLDGPDCALVSVVRSVEREGLILHGAGTELVESIEGADQFVERVTALRTRAHYDDLLAEYAELAARRGELDASRSPETLADSEAYEELTTRLDTVLSELEAMTHDFERRDFEAAFETPDFTGQSRISRAGWIS